MSNHTVPASAEGFPALTRRNFLGRLGATSAVVVAAGTTFGAQAAETASDMPRFIEAARLSQDDWLAACNEQCDAEEQFGRRSAEFQRADARQAVLQVPMRAAMLALLSCRPASLGEVAERFGFLLGEDGPWRGCLPEEWELDALFASMMGEEA